MSNHLRPVRWSHRHLLAGCCVGLAGVDVVLSQRDKDSLTPAAFTHWFPRLVAGFPSGMWESGLCRREAPEVAE